MGCGASAPKADKKAEVSNTAQVVDASAAAGGERPDGFPAGVPVARQEFETWANHIKVAGVWTSAPTNEDDVVAIVNWAAKSGWNVRAVGIKHNWVPFTIVDGQTTNVVLLNLMAHFNQVLSVDKSNTLPLVKVQAGMGQLAFLTAIEKEGLGLVHTPAPDSISIGGMITIAGHGTAIPVNEAGNTADPSIRHVGGYGSYSNRVVAYRAVVYDQEKDAYVAKDFQRGQEDGLGDAYLTPLGRSLLLNVTLVATPDYNMRCRSFTNVGWEELMCEPSEENPTPDKSFAAFLNDGRGEIIWFPFSEKPWLKVWSVAASKPEESVEVKDACNYKFSDTYPPFISNLFKAACDVDVPLDQTVKDLKAYVAEGEGIEKFARTLVAGLVGTFELLAKGTIRGPGLTPSIGKIMEFVSASGLERSNTGDIWGPSKNTLIYLRDSTLRVTANGYVVICARKNLQRCVYEFIKIYKTLIEEYAKEDKYPINAPLEIRVVGLDNPADIASAVHGPKPAGSTPVGPLHYDERCKANGWDIALYLDVLSLPGTVGSNEYYEKMETQMMANEWFKGTNGLLRPEWSKGWGYTATEGPWTNQAFIDYTRRSFPQWNETIGKLDVLDPKKVFSNPFMEKLLAPVD